MKNCISIMSTLFVFGSDLSAEAITEKNIGYFQITMSPTAVAKVVPTVRVPKNDPPVVPPVRNKVTPPAVDPPVVPPIINNVTPPASSVPLTLETDGIWRDVNYDIIKQQISDHALEGQMIDEDIPVYTWNTLGFGAGSGFSAQRESDLTSYTNGRLKEQIGILYQIFSNSPEAIICLQEVNEQTGNARTAMLDGLKSLGVEAEYLTNTGPARGKPGLQSFGQVILYRKDRYKPVVRGSKPTAPRYSVGAEERFDPSMLTDKEQTDRVLKVYFKELTGKKRQFAVINVHLNYNSPDFDELAKALVGYSQGKDPKPLAIITGDFNHTFKSFNNTDSKVTVKQVGKSVGWNPSTKVSSTKETANNVDGFIIVQP